MNATPIVKPTCGNCKHFQTNPAKVGKEGWCKAHPPQVAAIAVPTQMGIQINQVSGWPTIMPTEPGCGEHRPRLDA